MRVLQLFESCVSFSESFAESRAERGKHRPGYFFLTLEVSMIGPLLCFGNGTCGCECIRVIERAMQLNILVVVVAMMRSDAGHIQERSELFSMITKPRSDEQKFRPPISKRPVECALFARLVRHDSGLQSF